MVSEGGRYTAEQQFAPMWRHSSRLASDHGALLRWMSLEDALTQDVKADVLGVLLDYDAPAARVEQIVEKLIRPAQKARGRAILFDGDDDPLVVHKAALDVVDFCVKKHVFADRAHYAQPTVGKTNLTDYAARTFGRSFTDDCIPAAGGQSAQNTAKIKLGWNIALDDKIVDLARTLPAPDHGAKDIDILCRASVASHVWTHEIRDGAVAAIKALPDSFAVHAPTDRVPQDEYYREMTRSRLSLSPFGFGEICWRDFESILSGAVLIKPDMSHIETAPDLFEPGQTYLPIKWDYTDLEEVVSQCLADEERRREMADRARQRLLDVMTPEWFVARFHDTVIANL